MLLILHSVSFEQRSPTPHQRMPNVSLLRLPREPCSSFVNGFDLDVLSEPHSSVPLDRRNESLTCSNYVTAAEAERGPEMGAGNDGSEWPEQL